MDEGTFKTWLDAYGRAWETRNPDAAAGLFTRDATYHETPCDEPARGHAEILEYWSEGTRSQEDIHFSYETLAVKRRTRELLTGARELQKGVLESPSQARRHLSGEAEHRRTLRGVSLVVAQAGVEKERSWTSG